MGNRILNFYYCDKKPIYGIFHLNMAPKLVVKEFLCKSSSENLVFADPKPSSFEEKNIIVGRTNAEIVT